MFTIRTLSETRIGVGDRSSAFVGRSRWFSPKNQQLKIPRTFPCPLENCVTSQSRLPSTALDTHHPYLRLLRAIPLVDGHLLYCPLSDRHLAEQHDTELTTIWRYAVSGRNSPCSLQTLARTRSSDRYRSPRALRDLRAPDHPRPILGRPSIIKLHNRLHPRRSISPRIPHQQLTQHRERDIWTSWDPRSPDSKLSHPN